MNILEEGGVRWQIIHPFIDPEVEALTDEDLQGLTRMEIQGEGYIYICDIVSATIVKNPNDRDAIELCVEVSNSKRATHNGLMPTSPFESVEDKPYKTTLLNTRIVDWCGPSTRRLILHNGINEELICLFPPRED